MTDDLEQQWFFNLKTRQVEQGPQSGSTHRMGPYESRDAALHALERAEARNEAADEADEAWER